MQHQSLASQKIVSQARQRKELHAKRKKLLDGLKAAIFERQPAEG